MTEAQAKQHLLDMLGSFTAGSVLHLLSEVIREAEEARLDGLDAAAEERVWEVESFLWVAGYGLLAALPR